VDRVVILAVKELLAGGEEDEGEVGRGRGALAELGAEEVKLAEKAATDAAGA
jgi:hypothetical protein